MPKFEKGSIEMKNYMAELRAKKGTTKDQLAQINKLVKSIYRI